MFYQIFLSPEVKRCAIITYKHDIYTRVAERLKTMGLTKLVKLRKVFKPDRMVP